MVLVFKALERAVETTECGKENVVSGVSRDESLSFEPRECRISVTDWATNSVQLEEFRQRAVDCWHSSDRLESLSRTVESLFAVRLESLSRTVESLFAVRLESFFCSEQPLMVLVVCDNTYSRARVHTHTYINRNGPPQFDCSFKMEGR